MYMYAQSPVMTNHIPILCISKPILDNYRTQYFLICLFFLGICSVLITACPPC